MLLRRKNTGYCDGKLTLPSGHVEKGESISMAAIRELEEETGLEITLDQVKLKHIMHRIIPDYPDYVDFYFKITKYYGSPKNCEPHKCAEIIWSSIDNLPNDVIDHVRKAIELGKKKVLQSTWHV